MIEESTKKYKVLVVDDSAFMRRLISNILSQNPRIEVVGTAFNGRMALRKLKELPEIDAITLDVEMPLMNGLETLEEIIKIKNIPVIMCSSLTGEGASVTIKALELGAFDFIQKPDVEQGASIKNLETELPKKILLAVSHSKKESKPTTSTLHRKTIEITQRHLHHNKILIIGSSTGGPQALKQIIPYLPADFPAPILIVQHMPAKFTEMFADRLNKLSQIDVSEAKEGDVIKPGKALLAPGGYHMVVEENGKISLNQEPPMWGVRPAVDMTLASLAKHFGSRTISVILTGMGRDGKEGVTALRKAGGKCLAEHESSCVVYGMPKCVIEAGQADVVAPIEKMTEEIINAISK